MLNADLFPNTEVINCLQSIPIIKVLSFFGGEKIGRKPSQMESTMKHKKMFTAQLEDLPVEVLLNVFNCLELADRYRLGQVSKRLKSVSLVESLWQKIRLLNKTVSISLVKNILNRGCKTLCLKRCRLTAESGSEAANLHSIFDKLLLGNQIKANEMKGSFQMIN